jgi:hypothetical protein
MYLLMTNQYYINNSEFYYDIFKKIQNNKLKIYFKLIYYITLCISDVSFYGFKFKINANRYDTYHEGV